MIYEYKRFGLFENCMEINVIGCQMEIWPKAWSFQGRVGRNSNEYLKEAFKEPIKTLSKLSHRHKLEIEGDLILQKFRSQHFS